MRVGIETNVATAIALGTIPGQGLDLARVAWEGGPAYWTTAQNGTKMTKAQAAGWSDPSFFPISVFLPQPPDAQAYLDLGFNTMQAADSNHPPITQATDLGMFVLANPPNPRNGDPGWTTGDIGTNPLVVGWFLCDEPDQGYAGFIGTDDEDGWLASLNELNTTYRALNDGRFMFVNFGSGIAGTFWSPNNFTTMVRTPDAACVDKYCYTTGYSITTIEGSPNWPGGSAQTSSAYGWMCKELRTRYDDPNNRRPFWVFVETKMPNATDIGESFVILYDQIEGAIWSAIANEARGLAYFDYNGAYPGGEPVNDPNTGLPHCTGSFGLLDCEQGLRDKVLEINTRVTALATVLNTQSYVFNFGATSIDTMLKAKDGFAYIFASLGPNGATGSKTFTLTGSGITGTTVTVLYESRTISVSGGQFTDSFANEYSHHIYRIPI